jgi:hypothetical protein
VAIERAELGRVPRAGVSSVGRQVKVIVLGSLGEDVLTPDIYHPALNPLYRDVLAHYASSRCPGTALGPLPVEPFRCYRFGDRTVHLNGCVEVEGAYCGAPSGWLGQRVQVQWNDLYVRLLGLKTGQLLREQLRTHGGR